MKILHVVSGELNGGAARGALWLHKGMLKQGIESRLLSNTKSENDHVHQQVYFTNEGFFRKYLQLVYRYLDQYVRFIYPKRKKRLFSAGFGCVDITKNKHYLWCDVIHLHWVNGGFLSTNVISKLEKPIVWTMRDMWPYTGGCHYTMECERFKTSCGSCPALGSENVKDASFSIHQRKMNLQPINLHLVGISRWIAQKSNESSIFRDKHVDVIANNVDVKDFYPTDKNEAKKQLGLSLDRPIILTGAQDVSDYYKGFEFFLKTMKLLGGDYNYTFFGKLDETTLLNYSYRSFGFVGDIEKLRLIYSAADVFVCTSLQEAFGKTLIEAMACGTPVATFNHAGPADIVSHKEDGYQAKHKNAEDLACGIKWIIQNNEDQSLSRNAISSVHNKFDVSVISKKYQSLYNNILNKRSS